jgi:hypothetical protein
LVSDDHPCPAPNDTYNNPSDDILILNPEHYSKE